MLQKKKKKKNEKKEKLKNKQTKKLVQIRKGGMEGRKKMKIKFQEFLY